MEQDRKVVWRALLDIVNLRKNAKEAERELKNLEDRERSVGQAFKDTDTDVKKSVESQTRSSTRLRASMDRMAAGWAELNRKQGSFQQSLRETVRAQEQYNKSAAQTEALHNKEVAAQARLNAAKERFLLTQQRLADAQRRASAAEAQHEALLKKSTTTVDELTKANNELEKAHARVATAAAKEAEASSAVARAHSQSEKAAKANAKGNDDLAVSLERVRSKQIQLEKASSSRFGRNQQGVLTSLRNGYNSLARAAGNFTDILLIKAPAAAAGLAAIGSVLSSLVAGATALVGALGPLVGILGAIPGAFLGAATGIGSMLAAFKGVGSALKAYSADQKNATKTTQQDARAQQQAARSVRDAKRGVRDAYEAAARAAESSNQRIESAEKNLARSQKEARQAQVDLNRAREEAIRQLEDMKKSVRDAGFSEEEAVIALEEARKRLAATKTDANASQSDLARADLDYREAQARLEDARKAKGQAIKDNAEAQRKGVAGSDLVVNAQDRVVQSTENVKDAQKELASAQKDAIRQQRDSSEAIQRAIENQSDAQRNYADAVLKASGAQSKYAEEMKKLSPEAQRFVKYLISLKGNLTTIQKTAQAGLLPGAQKGLQSLMTMFPMINRTVGNTSKIIGDTFANLGAKLSSPANSAAIGRVFTSNEKSMKIFSRGIVALAGYFVHVADAARPLTEYLATMFEQWAKSREAIPTKEMETFFGKTQKVLGKVTSILGNLWRGLKNVGRAGEDFGNDMLDSLDEVTKKWADWTGSMEGQSELKKWFDDAKPVVYETAKLFRDITKAVLDLSNNENLAPFISTLRTEVLPNVKKVFDILSGGNTMSSFSDFLVKISDALVKFAESGAMGGLSKALDFLGTVIEYGSKILQIPGVGAVLSTMAAGLFAFKGLKLAAQVTGISNLYDGIKKLFDLGKSRSSDAKQIADDIAALAEATGQSPEQVAAAYGTTTKGKKAKKGGGIIARVTGRGGAKPAPTRMNQRSSSTPRRSSAPKPRAGRIAGAAGGIGAVAGIAASFLPLDGILGTIVPLLASMAGVILPALGAAFAAIGAPILIIVGIIAAVVTGLVLLFNKNKAFHDFVVNAWENIKKVISSAWNDYIYPALETFWHFITDTLIPALKDFWENTIKPIFSAIGSFIAAAWNNVIKPVLSALWGFISELLIPLFFWLWKQVIQIAFKAIGAIISFAWNNVIKPVFKGLWDFIKNVLAPVFMWIWKNIIKPAFDGIGAIISWAWNNVIKPVFKTFSDGVSALATVFSRVRDAIVDTWNGLTGALQGPVQSALRWIQQNMIDPINKFLKGIGITWQIGAIWTKPAADPTAYKNVGRQGTSNKLGKNAYASGGVVGGSSPHDRADNIPAMLTAGEFVLPVRAVRAISQAAGPGYLEQLRQGRVNNRRYASGGFVRPVKGNPAFPWGHYPSGSVHRALDIPVPVGTPVVSAENGTVIRAGWDRTGFGNHVRLGYDNGTYMILGHLSRIMAKEGQKVHAGQLVGYSGNTGNSTGPHVHVEMRTSPYRPDSAYNFSNLWYGGKVPPFMKAVKQDTLLSNIALSTYDVFSNPVKSLMNNVLPKFGFPGQFMLGAGQKILEGVRARIADWTQTTAYIPDKGNPNAPRDRTSGSESGPITQTKQNHSGAVLGLNSGGSVPGTGNSDTVPAMLTPGEFVVRKAAVKAIGIGNLMALNNGGDGGRSQYRNGIGYFNAGGPVTGRNGVRVAEGGKYRWMNLVRLMLGLGYSSLGLQNNGLFNSTVSNAIRARKGDIPTGAISRQATAAEVKRIAAIVNSGSPTRQKSLYDVATAMKISPLTMALMASRSRASIKKYDDSRRSGRFWNNVAEIYREGYREPITDLAKTMGLPDPGGYTGTLHTALKHMMYHGMATQWPHGDSWPTPWPLTALQTAVQQQNANNALTTEFNKALDTLSSWGYGYLVEKLNGLGPTDGIGLAREAVKSRSVAASYNASLEKASNIAATSDAASYKFAAFLTNNASPGIRNSARELGVPDFQVVEMWDKLVKAGRINAGLAKFAGMKRDIDLYRKGVFYAATGGMVPGTGSGDTVPAMLTPGEFVLRKSAVRALGMDNLRALNNVQYFADGGAVYNPQVAGLPALRSQGTGLAARLARAGEAMTTVNINTNIYNPVAEPSTASFNKNLRRQSAVGAFGVNGVIGKDVTNG